MTDYSVFTTKVTMWDILLLCLLSITNLVLLYTLLFRRPQAKITEGTGGQLVGNRVVGQTLYCIIMAEGKNYNEINQHITIQNDTSILDQPKYEVYRNIKSCVESFKHV